MKGERLGEFEEFLLLAVRGLGDETYAVPLQQHLEHTAGRRASLGAVYAGLDRLEAKGLLRSAVGDPSPQRGGKRKRMFTITRMGVRAIEEARNVRQRMWHVIEERKS